MIFQRNDAGLVLCAWFAKCDRPAAGVVNHAALGMVPICRRCAGFADVEWIRCVFDGIDQEQDQ